MQIWTALHVIAMFGTVMITLGGALLATWAIRRRDLDGLRAYFRLEPRINSLGGLLFLAGISFGIAAAVTTGWDLLTGWLVLAYVLVVLILIVGASIGPYLKQVKAALAAGDEIDRDTVSAELEAQLARPNATIASIVLTLLIAAVIWDMVTKPIR